MARQRITVAVLLLTVAAMILASGPRVSAEVAAPATGGVTRVATYVYYSGAQLEDETAYTAAPLLLSTGEDASRVADFHAVDLFVTATVSGTAELTTTLQYSADGTNWADAYYTEIISDAVTTVPYRVIQSTDGTQYLRAPIAGLYLRLAFEAEGAVTPAARVVLRNN